MNRRLPATFEGPADYGTYVINNIPTKALCPRDVYSVRMQ